MAKRAVLSLLLCCMLLCGCGYSSRATAQGASVIVTESPVGDDLARVAGLALIKQAFSLSEADGAATVSYKQVDGAADKNYYIVYIGGDSYESCKAFAHVRAYTGEAYRAELRLSELPMTDAQRAEAERLGATEDEAAANFSGKEGSCMLVANAFIEAHFPQSGEVKSVSYAYSETDSDQFPVFTVGCDVELSGGAVYRVEVAWPQMTVFALSVG